MSTAPVEKPEEVAANVKEYDPIHHTGDCPPPGKTGGKTATERASKGGPQQPGALDPGVDEVRHLFNLYMKLFS